MCVYLALSLSLSLSLSSVFLCFSVSVSVSLSDDSLGALLMQLTKPVCISHEHLKASSS